MPREIAQKRKGRIIVTIKTEWFGPAEPVTSISVSRFDGVWRCCQRKGGNTFCFADIFSDNFNEVFALAKAKAEEIGCPLYVDGWSDTPESWGYQQASY